MDYSNDDALNWLREAIQIYAPSWEESQISELLRTIFSGVNAHQEVDEMGNHICILGRGRPALLLASHMDTIPDPLEFREDEINMWGRGAVDCRSSLLALAIGACRAWKSGINGCLVYCGLVAEETSLDGVNHFLKTADRPDYVIFGEPTTIKKICIAYKGRVWLDVKISSTPGHVAAAWLYVNCINLLIEFYNSLKAELASLVKNKKLS
ncbi:MAG: M20/M25/M40 family metallo-hydrolase, partial [Promethearchaeota archaeon]